MSEVAQKELSKYLNHDAFIDCQVHQSVDRSYVESAQKIGCDLEISLDQQVIFASFINPYEQSGLKDQLALVLLEQGFVLIFQDADEGNEPPVFEGYMTSASFEAYVNSLPILKARYLKKKPSLYVPCKK